MNECSTDNEKNTQYLTITKILPFRSFGAHPHPKKEHRAGNISDGLVNSAKNIRENVERASVQPRVEFYSSIN